MAGWWAVLRPPSENWGQVLITMIAFGTAALLFLVTEELLTEAHEVKESPLMTSAFFIGFLAVFLLELLS